MGNCSLKGVTGECSYNNNIRLFTDAGGIIEMKGPKLAKNVLSEYPGYAIFRQGNASSPLSSYEYLIGGQFYYLLPLEETPIMLSDNRVTNDEIRNLGFEKKATMGLIESPKLSSGVALDLGEGSGPAPAVEVLPSQGNGVWKVKLVINPKQLEEILSEEGNTEALIEKMRMAASSAPSRRSKSHWKPCLSNVFKESPIDGTK